MEVSLFSDWLLQGGKTAKTIESYTSDVKGFQQYLDGKVNGNDLLLSRFLFVQYKEYLVKCGYATSTINKVVNSLKVYNDYLKEQGKVKETYIQLKRDRIPIAFGSEHQVEVLTEEQVEELLFYVEDSYKVSLRNKLIIYLLLYTGVRVSELVNIKLHDIDVLTSVVTVIGKGGKERQIGLRPDVLRLIQTYRQGERSISSFSDSPYLLVSQRAEKMHRDAVRSWLATLSGEIGFHLYPHLFRHTFCTRLLKKGVELTTVSRIAGHSTVSMTAKFYIQTTREEKQQAVELL